MKEVKFIVWDRDNKEMVVPYSITFQVKDGLEPRKLVKGDLVRIKNFKLLQYIGCKDKYGKKIFEGHILEDGWNNKHSVFWDSKQCKFMYTAGCEYAEIIGNIYENPELLDK